MSPHLKTFIKSILMVIPLSVLHDSLHAQTDPCYKFTESENAAGNPNSFTTIVPIICDGNYFVFGVTNTSPDMQYTFYSSSKKGGKKPVQGPLDGNGGSLSVQIAINAKENADSVRYFVEYKLKDEFGCSLVKTVPQINIAYGSLTDLKVIEQGGDSVRFSWTSITSRNYAAYTILRVSTSPDPLAAPLDETYLGLSGEWTFHNLQPQTRYYLHAKMVKELSARVTGDFCWKTTTFSTCAADDSSAQIVPAAPVINAGSSQQLKVTGGSNFQWLKNGVPIPGAIDSVYNASECGRYTVSLISNAGCKSYSKSSVLTMNVPKLTVTQSAPGFCTSDSVILTASGGVPAGYYEWVANNSSYGSSGNSRFSVSYQTDTITYRARMVICGNQGPLSNPVLVLPGIYKANLGDLNQFCPGSSFTLQVSKQPQHQYTWFKDGALISSTDDAYYSKVTINSTQTGQYKLKISRKDCNAFFETTTDVKLQPNAPAITGLQILNVTNSSVKFKWDSVVNYNTSYDYYGFQVSTSSNPYLNYFYYHSPRSGTIDSVSGLTTNTTYYLHVRVNSTCGDGPITTIAFKTSSICTDKITVYASPSCNVGSYLLHAGGGLENNWFVRYPDHTDSLYSYQGNTEISVNRNSQGVYGVVIKNGTCMTTIDSVFDASKLTNVSIKPQVQVTFKDSCNFRVSNYLKVLNPIADYEVGWAKIQSIDDAKNPQPFIYGNDVTVGNIGSAIAAMFVPKNSRIASCHGDTTMFRLDQIVNLIPYFYLNTSSFPINNGGAYCTGDRVVLRMRFPQGSESTWYKDNVQIQTGGDSLAFNFDATRVGTYTALIKNTCGTTYQTNSAIITAKKSQIENVLPKLLTTNFAEFTWSLIQGGANYEYAFTTSSTPPASGTVTYDTTAYATYLKDYTKYYLHVRGNTSCGTTPWTTTSFTTLPICIAKTLLLTTNSSTSICSGNSVVLTAPVGASYKWFKDGQIVNGSTQTYSATTAGKFKVEVQDTMGCKNLTNEITVTLLPTPLLKITDPVSTCSSVNLTSSDITSGSGSGLLYTYWKDTSATLPLQNPSTTNVGGTYFIKATGSNNCSTILPVHVSIVPLPAPVISSNLTSICAGDSVVITSNSSVGNKWFLNGQDLNFTGPKLTAKTGGSYTLQVIDKGCTSPVSNPVTVEIRPLPAVPTITAVGNTLSSSSSSGNQWYLNGSLIQGATSQQYQVQASGIYTVTVTQSNCSSTSSQFNFVATAITSPTLWNGDVVISPNPVVDQLSIINNKGRKLFISIIDVTGKTVRQLSTQTRTTTVNMQMMSKGIYIVSIIDLVRNQTVRKAIIKQ